MTDQELKKLVAGLARAQAVTDRQMRENDRRLTAQLAATQKRFDEEFAATQKQFDEQFAATQKQIIATQKQLGELGNKFGSFTEGMAWPSMQKLLTQRFKMDTVGPRVVKHLNGRTMELDVLAYANGEVNAVYVVEVKSHLRPEGVKQVLTKLQEFLHFFPEHRGKRIHGILAAVDVSKEVRRQVHKAGLYLARIHDENFNLDLEGDFRVKDFGQ